MKLTLFIERFLFSFTFYQKFMNWNLYKKRLIILSIEAIASSQTKNILKNLNDNDISERRGRSLK